MTIRRMTESQIMQLAEDIFPLVASAGWDAAVDAAYERAPGYGPMVVDELREICEAGADDTSDMY